MLLEDVVYISQAYEINSRKGACFWNQIHCSHGSRFL